METKLIFHFGVHKTGTTSIQAQLTQQKPQLAKQGIGVIDRNTFFGAFSSLFFKPKDVQQDQDQLEDMKFVLEQWVKVKFGDYHTLIISDERCSYVNPFFQFYFPEPCYKKGEFIKDRQLFFKRLATITESFDTSVMVFVRPQDQLIESLYTQLIKSLHFFDFTFEEFLNLYDFNLMDWELLLTQLKTAFGKNNVKPFWYTKQAYQHKDVSQFFFENCGWIAGDLPAINRQNSQLHKRYVERLRAFNQYCIQTLYNKKLAAFKQVPFELNWINCFNKQVMQQDLSRRFFSERYAPKLVERQDKEYTFFNQQQHQEFCSFYEKSNQVIQSSYKSLQSKIPWKRVADYDLIKQEQSLSIDKREYETLSTWLYGRGVKDIAESLS